MSTVSHSPGLHVKKTSFSRDCLSLSTVPHSSRLSTVHHSQGQCKQSLISRGLHVNSHSQFGIIRCQQSTIPGDYMSTTSRSPVRAYNVLRYHATRKLTPALCLTGCSACIAERRHSFPNNRARIHESVITRYDRS